MRRLLAEVVCTLGCQLLSFALSHPPLHMAVARAKVFGGDPVALIICRQGSHDLKDDGALRMPFAISNGALDHLAGLEPVAIPLHIGVAGG